MSREKSVPSHELKCNQNQHAVLNVHDNAERKTQLVLLLTAVTMVVEIVAGTLLGSMALLADGWHMGTHVAAFFITLFAYRYSRKHANNPALAFGTGKVNVLGGFTSAIALAAVAMMMLVESAQRIVSPHDIRFNEAIMIASLGLLVNLVSVFILRDAHHHHDTHHHDEQEGSHQDHHHDHNLSAAYFHVLADTLTSVLAIVALAAGKLLGWNWLDPVIGIVGSVIILRWAYGLLQQTAPILLDASIAEDLKKAIINTLNAEQGGIIADLHVWKISANHYAAIISLSTQAPYSPQHYKKLLAGFNGLTHITIEVNKL